MKKDIVKSNALIEASYSPGSVYRMRLIMACLLQIKAGEKLSHKQTFTVTANALADLTGSAAKNNYRELAKAADDLMDMIITVPNYRPNDDPRKVVKRRMNVVAHCDYTKHEGKVEIDFTHSIIPYISQLKKHFTKYQAKYVMPMKSSYGVRLYELCLQWMGDEREFEIEDFKELLGLDDQYQILGDLKRRVINPALRDINTYSDIRVAFGQRKAGRRVTHLQFKITRQEAEKPAPIRRVRQGKITRAEIEEIARPNESWAEAEERLKNIRAEHRRGAG